MKGVKIEIENEQPLFLYLKRDVIGAIAHALYYTVNPYSELCIPHCAYERAEKMFDEWANDTRVKKAIEIINESKE